MPAAPGSDRVGATILFFRIFLQLTRLAAELQPSPAYWLADARFRDKDRRMDLEVHAVGLQDRSHSAQDRRIALLIDADNVPPGKIAEMLVELSTHGTANIRRAYGDWSSPHLKSWKDKLHAFAIRPIQQFSYSTGKNASDIALVIDAMELLYTQKVDAFCIASSDADFTPLAMHLRSNGQEVYGFGERKTPSPFVDACTAFFHLDAPVEPPVAAPPPKPAALPKHTAKPNGKSPPQPAPYTANKKLAGDTKLVTLLRAAVKATARKDGWAHMAAAGKAVKQQAPTDPRTYGVKDLTALFLETDAFEVMQVDKGARFVADKDNKQRTERPSL